MSCRDCKHFKWVNDICDDSCEENCGPWYSAKCLKEKFTGKMGEVWQIEQVKYQCFQQKKNNRSK